MIKRIGVLMLSLLILMGCIGVSAADERVFIGEITVQTEEGVTTVSAQVLSKPEGKSAVLVAAYMEPETGRILSVNVNACDDVSLLEGDNLSVTLDDKTEEGGVLSYNVWDSLAGNMSLLNNSPTAPTGLMAASEVSDATISWEGALDDYDATDALSYNIYDDGMLVEENYASLEYNAEKLASGSFYNFEVRAVDSEGKESEVGEVSVTTKDKNAAHTYDEYTQSPDGNVIFTGTVSEQNRNFYVTKGHEAGLDCYWSRYRIVNDVQSQAYLTYRLSDDYFAQTEGATHIAYEFTYFDEGTSVLSFEAYVMGTNGKMQARYLDVPKTNTNSWRTVRRIYPLRAGDYFAYNDNVGNGSYNFRISCADWKTTGIKVRDFKVYPIFDESGKTDEYYTLKKNAGSYLTADGGTVFCDLTTNAAGLIPEEIGDRTGIRLSEVSGGEVNFKVTDSSIMAGNVKVLVTYYAPDDDTTITFNGEEKAVTASKKWQKMCFDVTNIGSKTYTITSNKDIAINAIRVIAAD